VLALAATAAVVAATLNVPAASADVPAPYFASSANRADPHVITCTHPTTGVNGFCLYTSKDMGQSQAYPPANYYPMVETRVHWSPNGYSGWTDEGVAFHEDDISWVPNDAKHQWAPAAVQSGSYYYLYVPNVACTAHTGSCNIHNSSRIAVARSTNPFGPFDYQGYVPH